MEKLITVLETILPIAAAMLAGFLIRKKKILSPEGVQGMQDFACKIGLPCLMFRSCYTAEFSPQTLVSMAVVLPTALLLLLISLLLVRRRGATPSLPLYLATKEGGMLGMPLFLILFGEDQIFRMASLDASQLFVAILTISIVSAGASLSSKELLRRVFTSPLMLGALTGLILNLTGLRALLTPSGADLLITTTADFFCAPISCIILVTIGYTFSLRQCAQGGALRLCAIMWAVFAAQCLLIQGLLSLVPDTVAETRWAVLLFCALPPTFMAPSVSREEDRAVAAGVCSICTVMTMAVFFLITLLSA